MTNPKKLPTIQPVKKQIKIWELPKIYATPKPTSPPINAPIQGNAVNKDKPNAKAVAR